MFAVGRNKSPKNKMKKICDRIEWFLENLVFSIATCIVVFISWALDDGSISEKAFSDILLSLLEQTWTRKVEEK